MMQYELISEDLSGDTLFVEVSAIKKLNLDKLKESILTTIWNAWLKSFLFWSSSEG